MKKNEFQRRAIRHGEVVLIPVDHLPEVEMVQQGQRVIVGHSESGHHHVAVCDTADLKLFRPVGADSPDLYLEITAPSRIEHEKSVDQHKTQVLEEGYLRIVNKTEYDYFTKIRRAVQD